jgi:hypothetical protein
MYKIVVYAMIAFVYSAECQAKEDFSYSCGDKSDSLSNIDDRVSFLLKKRNINLGMIIELYKRNGPDRAIKDLDEINYQEAMEIYTGASEGLREINRLGVDGAIPYDRLQKCTNYWKSWVSTGEEFLSLSR